MYACLHAPGNLSLLVECARGFSPHIEENPPDSVIFDACGLEALHGPPAALAQEIERRAGVKANIAVAPNPDAALHAARGIAGITVVEEKKEAEALAKLPINLLGGSPDFAETLHLWGIRTFGDFAKLPPLGVAARLGEEGVELQRLARGEGYRRLRPIEDPLEFEAELELEYPVELLEPLAFVMARLLKDICERLASRALATNEIRLKLTLESAGETVPTHETALKLPVPMLDQKAFLRMLQLDLSGRPPMAPVVKVHMAAEPVKPRLTQHGLFVPTSPEPEKLELTVARVRHLVGADRVGSPEISNTHRPDAFAMRAFAPRAAVATIAPGPELPRLCLRRFRPPRYAQVLIVNQQPVRVISPSISGRVAMSKGPWRTSGEWWREDAWNRDEWDVALESGGVYRIYRENDSGRWFVEGVYD
jgi:protein ImuB